MGEEGKGKGGMRDGERERENKMTIQNIILGSLKKMCLCLSGRGYVHRSAGTHRGQKKRVLDPLEPEL